MTAAAVVSCTRLITALKQPALDQRAVGERLLAFTRAAKYGASRRAAGGSGASADAGICKKVVQLQTPELMFGLCCFLNCKASAA
jgi:hypothetical protein